MTNILLIGPADWIEVQKSLIFFRIHPRVDFFFSAEGRLKVVRFRRDKRRLTSFFASLYAEVMMKAD